MKGFMGHGWACWVALIGACSLGMWGCSEPVESGSPSACTPGAQDCEGNTIIQCDLEGNWTVFQLCAPSETCGLASGTNQFVCAPPELDGQGTGGVTAGGKDAGEAQSDGEGVSGDSVGLDAQVVEEDASGGDATTDSQDSDPVDGVTDTTLVEEWDAPSDGSVEDDSGEGIDASGDATDGDAPADGIADMELGDGSDGTDGPEDDTADGFSEEIGACEEEKLGGTFDEDSLQAKLLTAGIACQDPEEFGSIEHANCLRAQFMETGIGPDCADCFSNFVLCFFAECAEACADVDTNPEPCVECKDATTCDESLNECAGLNW